jgi:hypothetical protein
MIKRFGTVPTVRNLMVFPPYLPGKLSLKINFDSYTKMSVKVLSSMALATIKYDAHNHR